MGQNDLSCIGPSLWNNLRGSLKKKNSVSNACKHNLKKKYHDNLAGSWYLQDYYWYLLIFLTHLFIYLLIHLFVYLFIYLFIYSFIIYLFIYLFIFYLLIFLSHLFSLLFLTFMLPICHFLYLVSQFVLYYLLCILFVISLCS